MPQPREAGKWKEKVASLVGLQLYRYPVQFLNYKVLEFRGARKGFEQLQWIPDVNRQEPLSHCSVLHQKYLHAEFVVLGQTGISLLCIVVCKIVVKFDCQEVV